MGIVIKAHESDDKNIRSVTIRHNKNEYVRPVNKLVVLVENDDWKFPAEGAI